MYLKPNVKHRLKIQVGEYLEGDTVSFCSDLLHDNLNFLDHVTCNAVGSILEVIFHPPNEITDDFIFDVVTNTIQNAGLSFIGAVMSQYVGSNTRTATGSLIGGLLGGIIGGLSGLNSGGDKVYRLSGKDKSEKKQIIREIMARYENQSAIH